MSKLQVDTIVNLDDSGAPSLSYGAEVPVGYGITGAGGINVSGAATVAAGTFSGAVNIDATTDSTSSTSGALIVDGGLGVAKNVYIGAGLSVAGTLTYEDVTNVDSVGLITAKSGLRVNAGGVIVTAGVATFSDKVTVTSTLTGTEGLHVTAGLSTFAGRVNVNSTLEATEGLNVTAGISTFAGVINAPTFDTNGDGVVVTGIVTASVGCDFNGYKVEEGSYDTDALNGEFDFLLEDGHVQTHTGSTAGTYFPDFKVSSGVSLNEVMGVGDVVSATLIVTASNTSHYCTGGTKIDNSTSNVTVEWIGSEAPTEGKGAGYDIYAFTIQKTAATPAYLVIVNATNAG